VAPAGTELAVRTGETIDSQNAGARQTFSAIVEQEVRDESARVIIPERSSAQLLIWQLSSGGKGAAIDVLVDAAGGATAQVLTRAHDVRVPAETVLKFRLDQPVTLQAEQ